ncbi:Gfo/Idh/MocA family oxidoreductase [Pelagicoccus sp. SDUM812005]|uniref:Gfo/Idh/MocA family oxidoreductase n=1 Tax=Pelagicoccus sp. SDUM812005 TaxID=3041257 RepID=UPI0028104BFF|nr:Gfo/Idh/MocA family oxidoreductase [Pelagicoccus sp. SDUM812005]MDQ8182124.1 Gfo/Idh/MocA family oxidoreductase [Pelagicoccus sp. SDUM812005]
MKPTPAAPPADVSRRNFLKASAAFGAFAFLPSRMLWGAGTPNEKVRLACIGIGNRGKANINNIAQNEICEIVALCDVDLQGEHTAEIQKNFPKARKFSDFRKLFDEMADQIDAVLISTPDHSHFSITMLAMSLGKHVYVEKPLAHTFGQVERLMDLAQRSGVVTQMGNQGHSGANYFQFKAWTEAGFIKDVTRITAHMNNKRRWHGWGQDVTAYPQHPVPAGMDWDLWMDYAPEHPFSDKLHPAEWRSWFDYGSGAFGDWGPHILDTCHEFLHLGLPQKISAVKREGANEFVFPQASTIKFAFPKRGDMPKCDITWYDGTENIPEVEAEYGKLEKDPATGKTSRAPVEIKKPGKIIYSKDLVFQGGSHEDYLKILPYEKYMDMRRHLPRFPQKNSNHYLNFLRACKGEEQSRSPFSVSGPLTQVFNLGCIAQRLGGTLKFSRTDKRITNNKLANALLDPAPRKGWEQYYRL